MKVCHFPRGWPMLSECKALKSAGVAVHAYDFFPHKFYAPADFTLDFSRVPRDRISDRITQFVNEVKDQYDVFHLHMMLAYSNFYCPKVEHLRILKSLGKRLVVEHHGSDARRMSLAKENNPYFRERPDYVGEPRIVYGLQQLSTVFDDAIVHDYELVPHIKEFYQRVHVIPYPFDSASVNPVFPDPAPHEPLIIHAPTDSFVKGTEFVQGAVNRLQEAGYRFRFQLAQNLRNEQLVQLYQQADIVIDQLCIGAHGIVSMEAMAHGKAVVCYIKEEMVDKYPEDLPIVNANPDSLEQVLASLLENPERVRDVGVRGRAYVEKYHNPQKIAEQLNALYQM